MTQHSSARTSAETHFEKIKRKAQEGSEARAEHVALADAVTANTARLKGLRLDKGRADKEAAALIAPVSKKRSRPRPTKAA